MKPLYWDQELALNPDKNCVDSTQEAQVSLEERPNEREQGQRLWTGEKQGHLKPRNVRRRKFACQIRLKADSCLLFKLTYQSNGFLSQP